MNPKDTVPLAVTAAPLIAAAPPLLIGAAIGLGLIWLFSREGSDSKPGTLGKGADTHPASAARQARKRVRLEDLAEIFEHGERSLTRTEAVAELQALGIGKTAAYAALSPEGKFSAWFDYAPDGMLSWEG